MIEWIPRVVLLVFVGALAHLFLYRYVSHPLSDRYGAAPFPIGLFIAGAAVVVGVSQIGSWSTVAFIALDVVLIPLTLFSLARSVGSGAR